MALTLPKAKAGAATAAESSQQAQTFGNGSNVGGKRGSTQEAL